MMKVRATLLICLLISGAFVMYQSIEEYKIQGFHELFANPSTDVVQVVFTRPSTFTAPPSIWTVNDKKEIDRLLSFLDNVEIKKAETQLPLTDLDFNQFTVSLEDKNNHQIMILTEENLIVNETGEQFYTVNESFDVNWLLHFILTNQPYSS